MPPETHHSHNQFPKPAEQPSRKLPTNLTGNGQIPWDLFQIAELERYQSYCKIMLPDCGYNPDYKITRCGIKTIKLRCTCHPLQGFIKTEEYKSHKYIIPKGILSKKKKPACYKYLIPDGISLVILSHKKTPQVFNVYSNINSHSKPERHRCSMLFFKKITQ